MCAKSFNRERLNYFAKTSEQLIPESEMMRTIIEEEFLGELSRSKSKIN